MSGTVTDDIDGSWEVLDENGHVTDEFTFVELNEKMDVCRGDGTIGYAVCMDDSQLISKVDIFVDTLQRPRIRVCVSRRKKMPTAAAARGL